MSALPPSLATADEVAVLSALRRLLETRKVSASQARSLWVAWRAGQAREASYYDRFEMIKHHRRAV